MNVHKWRDKLALGVLYRTPKLSRQDSDILIQEVGRAIRSKNVCIMASFNYRNINWEGVMGDLESEDFLKVIQDNFLKKAVTESTRGNNILDLILINRAIMISELDVGGERVGSDYKEMKLGGHP